MKRTINNINRRFKQIYIAVHYKSSVFVFFSDERDTVFRGKRPNDGSVIKN